MVSLTRCVFFFSSRRRHTRFDCDWSSDVCSSDLYARVLGYRRGAPGLYFAPDRFSVLEARVVYQWQRRRWGLRTDGGVGSQQVFRSAAHQAEWHFGVALSRGWGANNEVALVGSITNSAGATSTTGTRTEGFRYRTVGLRFRQGL